MTRDGILNMPAGREMGRPIAEMVMGLSVYDGERKIVRYEGFHGQHKRTYSIPEIYVRVSGVANYSCDSYSTDIKYAWLVFEKYTKISGSVFNPFVENAPKGFVCSFDGINYALECDTASLAICRAALLAMEAKND